jgi:hypothetical protein
MQLLLIARPECPLHREGMQHNIIQCPTHDMQIEWECNSQRERENHTPLTQSCIQSPLFAGVFLFLYFSSLALSTVCVRIYRKLLLTHAERASVSFALSQPEPFRFICRTSGAERVSKDIARPPATLGARLRNASPDFKLIKWSSKRRCDTHARHFIVLQPSAWENFFEVVAEQKS